MTPAPAPDPNPAAPGPYDLLRNRNLLRYLAGRFAATTGQMMAAMAIGWEIYDRTGSAFALGLVGLTLMVPMFLFTFPAGHLADNHNRQRIIIRGAALMAIAHLGLTLISATRAPVGLMYACLFLAGSARTFLWAASASFLPQLVERKDFSRAVTWNSGLFHLSAILGPALGGYLIGASHGKAWPIYAATACATLFFCAMLAGVRVHQAPPAREKMTLATLLAGFRFVVSTRVIFGVLTLDMFAVLLGGSTALLPVFAKEILHVGPRDLGFLQAALPLGSVIGSVFLAHRRPLQKTGRSLLWAVAAFGLATIGFGLSPWFWLSFALLLSCGLADSVSIVVRHTLVQMLTPDEKRGRVSAVNNLFIGTSNELGEFESGSVAHLLGPAIGNSIAAGAVLAVATGGLGTILVVVAVALIWPEIRRFGALDKV